MKYLVLALVAVLSACKNTETLVLNKNEQNMDVALSFHVMPDNPSSVLVYETESTFCNASFVTMVQSVDASSEGYKLARVTFENSQTEEDLSVLFYYLASESVIMPLTKRSNEEFAESLGVKFALGEKIQTLIYFSDNTLGISVEPASKFETLLDIKAGETRTEEIEYSVLKLDFVPELIKFNGESVDAIFNNIKIQNDC